MLVLIVSKSMNNYVGSLVRKPRHLINQCFKTALRHSAVYEDDEKPLLNRQFLWETKIKRLVLHKMTSLANARLSIFCLSIFILCLLRCTSVLRILTRMPIPPPPSCGQSWRLPGILRRVLVTWTLCCAA